MQLYQGSFSFHRKKEEETVREIFFFSSKKEEETVRERESWNEEKEHWLERNWSRKQFL